MSGDKTKPIAIIGLNLKFPGDAVSPQAFWELIESGRNSAKEVPADRFNVDAFYHPDPTRLDSLRIRKAHFMEEDPRAFDAPFFSMSPAEAGVLDAQQRGLLEGAYRTFENAGIPSESIVGTCTSVYSASFVRDHEAITARDFEFQSPYQATGSGSSMLSNRISHFFDLSGPSLTVDTACSSSLIAFHLACQSLAAGESAMSLVCGSNTFLTPECQALALSNGGFLSPDGRSYSFDAKANGYGRGEGYGFVLLKTLDRALADGDVIRAVVRASGANQDGRTPVITQPSQQAQMELIRKTYAEAGLPLDETEYVEAHGTGTPVGDPLEAGAIGEAFREHRDRHIWVGSVKSNLGHLEGASGLAGLIKTVLSLEKGVIPPIASFEKANPAIDVVGLKVQFPSKPIPWPATASGIRRASVSSFGYGGTNAHVIVDDAYSYLRSRGLNGLYRSADGFTETSSPINAPTNGVETRPPFVILPLSAADQDGTRRQAELLQTFLAGISPAAAASSDYLSDLAYTLSTRRSVLPFRSFAVVDSLNSDISKFVTPAKLSTSSNTPDLTFIFTGQGAQYARMGYQLMQGYPVFRESLETFDAYLKSSLGCVWSALEELSRPQESSHVSDPALAQPLCTAIQVALVDLVRSFGIVPKRCCGHSSGEVAAAYCAGALTREGAWKIAYYRGLVCSGAAKAATTPTTMMSVGLSKDAVHSYLQEARFQGISLACVNSPINVTLSGPVDALAELAEKLDEQQVFAKKLPVPVGYHSQALKGAAEEYLSLIQSVEKPPVHLDAAPCKYYSSTKGALLSDLATLRDPKYWAENLVGAVHFVDAISAVVGSSSRDRHFFVEIGPQSALRRPVKDTLESLLGKEGKDSKWEYACVLQRPKQDDDHDVRHVLETVGVLWSHGLPIDLNLTSTSNKTREPRPLTDLPSYPFSRSTLYWEESRLSRIYSNRPFRRHALLGIRDRDWNPSEASWRHPIRFAEHPWILDHALNGSAIYPGAGMLVMAIEAVRQLHSDNQDGVSGYRLENVRFMRSIQVNDSERGTEAKVYLRPRRSVTSGPSTTAGASVWYDWRVFGNEGDDWVECAYGAIRAELQDETCTPASAARQQRFASAVARRFEEKASQCSLAVHHDQLYKNLSSKSGFDFGPYFQTLRRVRYDRSGHASAELAVREYAKTIKYAAEDPCVIHPTALDGVFHLGFTSLSQGGWKPIPTLMFTHLKELWISHKLFEIPVGSDARLRIATKQTMQTLRESEWDVDAMFADTQEPVIVARGERGTVVATARGHNSEDAENADSELEEDEVDEDGAARLSYGVDFQADLSLLTMQETQSYLLDLFNRDSYFSPPPAEVVDRGDAIALYYIEKVLDRIDKEGPAEFDKHLTRYVEFLRRIRVERDNYTLESRGLEHLSMEKVLEEAELEPTQKLGKVCGQQLYPILTGQVNALQVVFEGAMADNFYNSDVWSRNYRKVGKYISLLAHVNPQLRILEVGAGTGSSTGKILPWLVDENIGNTGDAMVRFAEYAYTDVSPGFFEKAKARFSHAQKHMRFQKLDLEVDPLEQGFTAGTYDVIMAGNCIHTVSDVVKTLGWLKKMLKPGGKIILAETTVLNNIRDAIIFGLLPGWWMRDGHWWSERGEEYRHDLDQGPILTEKQWDLVLRESGFTGGVEMKFRDHEEEPHHRVSLLVSSAPLETEEPAELDDHKKEKWIIVTDTKGSKVQAEFAKTLQQQFAAEFNSWAVRPDILGLETVSVDNSTNVISLLELDRPVLGNITAEDDALFFSIKKISLNTKRTIWLSTGGGPSPANPAADIAVGFGRSVCSERGNQGFINLNFEEGSEVTRNVSQTIRLLRNIHSIPITPETPDSEFTVRNELIHVPRIIPQTAINADVAQRAKVPGPREFTFGAGPKPNVMLTIQQPGMLDTLYYAEQAWEANEESAPLGDGEVEIEVQAASLNFRDVMVALGQIPGSGFGLDGSGIVTRAGQGCTVKPGDRVLYFRSGGCVSTYIRTSELSTESIPEGMDFHAAAAIPTVWSTVVYAFDSVARLGKGESVLIHAGAGAVGQAAIQLAKIRGADPKGIFVTVGSEAKRKLIKDVYGLPDSQIFYSRDATFAEDILHATGGNGVDVVLNSLGGDLLQEGWKITAPFGRFIDIGKSDILANSNLAMAPFQRNVTFAAVDIAIMYDEAPLVLKKLLKDVFTLFKEHPELATEGMPKPLHFYKPSQVEAPIRALQTGKLSGKAIIDFTVPDGDLISYRPAERPRYDFRGDATYVISGGLGGLGREIVRWMFDRGARYFILLSSKGPAGRSEVLRFLDEMASKGAQISATASDITKRDVLEATLKSHNSQGFPPVKGCIQAAMVLSDDMLVNMTAANWHKATAPKFQGSWNLHELMPRDLDFFVLLSSMSGIIGNPAQSNYAAGNTFEDSLARHRTAQGLKGVSFDLTIVLEAGWANENYDDVTKSLRAGLGGMTQAQVMSILDVLCDPSFEPYDSAALGARDDALVPLPLLKAQVINVHDQPSRLYRMYQDGVLHWLGKPLMRALLRLGQAETTRRAAGRRGQGHGGRAIVDYVALVHQAAARVDADDAGAHVVAQALVDKLSKSLSVPAEAVDIGKPAFVVGVDSLIAVELRYWFLKQFGVEVPVFQILKKQSILELAAMAAALVLAAN